MMTAPAHPGPRHVHDHGDTDGGDDNGSETSIETPSCPGGLFNFPPGSVQVFDADEEVMELYMSLSTLEPHSGGLGYLDPSSPSLDIRLNLRPSPVPTRRSTPTPTGTSTPPGLSDPGDLAASGGSGSGTGSKLASKIGPTSQPTSRTSSGAGRSRRKKEKSVVEKDDEVGFTVFQDPSALRSRKGDTGSVLWRSTLHLSRHILSQTHFPPSHPSPPPLLSPSAVASTRVLELGAGIGVLALAVGKVWKSWTATDQGENVRLIARNFRENGLGTAVEKEKEKEKGKEKVLGIEKEKEGVTVAELDWVEVSARHRRNGTWFTTPSNPPSHNSTDRVDLVVAVDCIYNEHLVSPLVDTIAAMSDPHRGREEGGDGRDTREDKDGEEGEGRGKGDQEGEGDGLGLGLVWVVVELRSPDVVRLFLDTWLSHPSGPWTIVRLSHEAMGDWAGSDPRWVGWVGWRS